MESLRPSRSVDTRSAARAPWPFTPYLSRPWQRNEQNFARGCPRVWLKSKTLLVINFDELMVRTTVDGAASQDRAPGSERETLFSYAPEPQTDI